MAKPVVDGIEKDLQGRAQVIRLDAGNEVCRLVAQRYRVRSLPTLLVLDKQGQVYDQVVGVPNRKAVVEMIETLEKQ